jgi:RHS repeat-associated protein
LKRYNRWLAIAIAIAIFFTSIPMESFAASKTSSPTQPKININSKKEAKIIGEVVEKRESRIKHYIKDDKTYEAVVYESDVHYKEGNKWKDIDNTLIKKVDGADKVLENKQNNVKVKFADSTDKGKLVKIKKDKYEISWNIDTPNKVLAEVQQNDSSQLNKLTENEREVALPNITSTIDYKEIYENVNLQYKIIGDDIKENIILNKNIDNPVFKFNLKTKYLIPKLSKENNTISFYDEADPSNQVFVMNAPFMYDSKGNQSQDIKIDLQEEKGNYILIIEANKQWLDSQERLYPVTIDPAVETPIGSKQIKDVHVSQKYSGTNYRDSVMLKVSGRGSTSLANRTYLSFNLPTLTSADLVIDARLRLSLYKDNPANDQVNVHKVSSPWDSSTVKWSYMPGFNSKIEDFEVVNGKKGAPFSWNITNVVKDWYTTGKNYGLMLKNNDEALSSYTEFYSSDNSDSYQLFRPYITINYINNTGLEDYWTYHSQDIGRAGTSYINDYNGNLILTHDDVSTNGSRMPLNLYHVYNTNDINSPDIGYGRGFRLNLSQRIMPQTIGGEQYYVYTDEDGTKHYLKRIPNQNNYADESGLNLTMAINASNREQMYTVKDKNDNKIIFNSSGYPVYIKDNNDNTVKLEYSGTILKKITDGSGRATVLNTDLSGRLLSIVDPSNRTTTYTYTSGLLTKITYPDGKYTTYTYDSSNKLTNAINFDGYKMTFTYTATAPYRVIKILESHTSGKLGEELNISYGYNTNIFTDYKGYKEIYHFNSSGNTTSIQDSAGNAQYYKYFENGGNKNKLGTESKLQKTSISYLSNHNVEMNNTDWGTTYWGDSKGSMALSNESSYLGKQSLKVQKTNISSSHYYYQTVYLEKGKTYTFSSYVKTNNISNVNGKGATLLVNYTDGAGKSQSIYSKYANGTSDYNRYEVTFTLPSNATSTTVYVRVGILNETGTAYFDALQLEEGGVANRYNLVENADFRYGYKNWTKNNLTNASDVVVDSTVSKGNLDNKVFKFTGEGNKDKNVVQTINVSGKAGDTFVLGGWSKGDSIALGPTHTTTNSTWWGIDIGFVSPTGVTQWHYIPFNDDSSAWQYVSDVAIASQDYVRIEYFLVYYKNCNTAEFDGLQLYKEEFGDSYQYDANGNIVSTSDLSKQQSKFGYSPNNDLINYTDPKGNNFNYTYDTRHNMTSATSSENVKYTFNYDNYGNPITTKVGGLTLFSQSSATYTSSGNYIKTIVDERGNVLTNNYNETRGILTSQTDAKGNTTSHTYDNLDRLLSSSQTVNGKAVTNNYSYVNDKIKTIAHNGFSYNFGYDELGNNTTVGVGTQNLITNIYEARSSKLIQSNYSNNQKISYGYDTQDRITSKKYTNPQGVTQERYKYEYDSSSNLGKLYDLVNGVTSRYIYDLSDRLVEIQKSDGITTKYQYDKNNNISKIIEGIGNKLYSTTYEYDKDDRQKKIITHNNKILEYNYDLIGRVSSHSLNTGIFPYQTKYTYLPGPNGSTTNFVSSIDNNGKQIGYTYDKSGNVETVTQNGKTIKYYYNEANQLIREDNQILNKTITYTYDLGGNLINKTEYAYTTATTPTSTMNKYVYSYSDTNWKDKLTNFNGKAITYDQIGNPLTYNGYNYTWEEGTQLKSIAKPGFNASYSYNDNGIRTQKIINGVTTKYNLKNDKVTSETNGQDNIFYSYDASNNLISMNLNGIEYFYVRNVQGDIIGLIDTNGSEVVSYTYDSWGKLISIDGSLKDTVGVKNPYRYKGYRYDTETGLYYLQSRYYDPEWGRFINADTVTGEIGELYTHNMFAYCDNNPINRKDSEGDWWTIVAGAAFGAGFNIATQLIEGKSIKQIDWKSVGASAVGGAIGGIGLGGFAGKLAFSGAGNIVSNRLEGKSKSLKDDLINGIQGVAVGYGGHASGKFVGKMTMKKFNKLPRHLKKAKLQKKYKVKGNMRNKKVLVNMYKLGIKSTEERVNSWTSESLNYGIGRYRSYKKW